MSAFDRLHPSVQHHVVNSLGWTGLREHQERAIPPILDGAHVLVQAPTAGGKTEAALLPVLSRLLTEGWGAPSVLYLCPIKALLNDLEVRVRSLAALFGCRVAVWHGDVNTSARRRILSAPPEILLATPESVEVMLVSRLVDERRVFEGLRAVIVDEVHAFAGDDRGWHLLGLLERVGRLAERPVQRIALSATLANPEALLGWFLAGRDEPHVVIASPPPAQADVDVQVDHVGSLENAALVIARLHAGEKRLVFCDSRSQVEALASGLRGHGVDTYVSHSSLSRDERLRAEAAFAQGSNCVIVATSTLELGIDVGDLDRVVQIDAPYTVASFLQRLGRSGRRAGSRRNCLFLTTHDDAFLRAVAVVRLWEEGFVEPVVAPALPYHVLAQQVIALTLQEGGCARDELDSWLGAFRATAGISVQGFQDLVEFMRHEEILFEDGGVLSVGAGGEARYGAKNFMEVFSVFLSPPLVTVFHGRTELGQVHEDSFQRMADRPTLLSLGGRGWRVTHLDRSAKRAFVEPADGRGRSRWLGGGQPMHAELAQAVKNVLGSEASSSFLSRRASERLATLRDEFAWAEPGATTLVREKTSARWWTFAGDRYNAAAVASLAAQHIRASYDSFSVSLVSLPDAHLHDAIRATTLGLANDDSSAYAALEVLTAFKFVDCVPPYQRDALVLARFKPGAEVATLARETIREVRL